jgi:hypothetical protein
MDQRLKRKFLVAVLVVLTVATGITVWHKLYNDGPQPKWWRADDKVNEFLYGSVGAEDTTGIPYWLWLVLPRMFHEHVTEPGGYAGLGRPWAEGKEMPAGFSKKPVGYMRVAGNCALCHATSRPGPSGAPLVTVAGRGQTTDVQPLLSFFAKCAKDQRFNADEILSQIDMVTKLSFLDRLSYRFVLIPRTRRAFLDGDSVMLDAALQLHRKNPHTDFTDTRLKALTAWLETQPGW